ncbi:tripartite tricarboxylate transporter TctB family protein [Bacillus sp. FJAT-18017]|uniref:tripartite tricarboxylate transporter TctB family protein n=1 Tax=Bacillus sp. FJAT-18017 TaxID=1705566 RepID=UPI0006ADD956|nr:tripartite tricarboxylate transporter TctB family protein [Bacillus sp. FJAT-18017]
MQKAGCWAAVITIIFSSVFLYQSTKVDYEGPLGFGPGFFPFWLSILLLVLSVLYLVISLKEEMHLSELIPKGKERLDFWMILLSMALFILLLERTGFVIAGALCLILLMYRTFKWYWTISLSVGISLFIFVIFAKALAIPLPVNSLGW